MKNLSIFQKQLIEKFNISVECVHQVPYLDEYIFFINGMYCPQKSQLSEIKAFKAGIKYCMLSVKFHMSH